MPNSVMNYDGHLFKTLILEDENFKLLFIRDKTSDKRIYEAELIFIWAFCDFNSPYWNIEDDIKITKCKDLAKLPKDWKIDNDIRKAIAFYNECLNTANPHVAISRELIKTLETAKDVVVVLNNNLKAYLKPVKDASEDITVDISKAVVDVKSLFDLSKQITSNINILDKALSDLLSKRQVFEVRGGGKVGLFEDPLEEREL